MTSRTGAREAGLTGRGAGSVSKTVPAALVVGPSPSTLVLPGSSTIGRPVRDERIREFLWRFANPDRCGKNETPGRLGGRGRPSLGREDPRSNGPPSDRSPVYRAERPPPRLRRAPRPPARLAQAGYEPTTFNDRLSERKGKSYHSDLAYPRPRVRNGCDSTCWLQPWAAVMIIAGCRQPRTATDLRWVDPRGGPRPEGPEASPMSAPEPEPLTPAVPPVPEANPNPAGGIHTTVGHPGRWALAAGLAAGLVAWLGGEKVWQSFEPVFALRTDPYPSPARLQELRNAEVQMASISLGLQGGVLGLAMGLAGGLARRSIRTGLLAAVLGMVLGGVAAVGLARVILPIYLTRSDPDHANMLVSLLIHGAIWSAVGVAGGLAFGVGLGGWRRVLQGAVGGFSGAVVGTLAFEVIAAPGLSARSDRPADLRDRGPRPLRRTWRSPSSPHWARRSPRQTRNRPVSCRKPRIRRTRPRMEPRPERSGCLDDFTGCWPRRG